MYGEIHLAIIFVPVFNSYYFIGFGIKLLSELQHFAILMQSHKIQIATAQRNDGLGGLVIGRRAELKNAKKYGAEMYGFMIDNYL